MTHRIGNCSVIFGIAGWSYPDWEGIVYERADREKLRTVAGSVDLIEINASFYDFLSPTTVERWLAATDDLPLRFSAKANRLFTHDLARPCDRAEIRAFARGVAPLRREGRLAALLFQFPFSFRDGKEARERLATLAAAFEGHPLVVEVRHRSWEDAEALEFVRALGFSVANLDMPVGAGTFQVRAAATGEPGYLRLHGRNTREWFTRGAGRDARYDYLYEDEELEEIAQRIGDLAGHFRELIVVTNNHYRGKALANLAELSARTGGAERALPSSLIRTYPRLAAVARALPEPAQATAVAPAGGEAEGPPRAAPTAARGGGEQRDLFEG